MRKKLFYMGVISLIILILFKTEQVMLHTKQALDMCYEIIIPSLFPFFVCSGILIYSGFGSVIARYSERIMRPLFNVAPSGAAALVLGIISGFPSGAVCARDLYKSGNLSKIEAERLLSFSNTSGPLFIIGTIGTAIYAKPIYGVTLYIIHIISSIAVGIIFRNYGKKYHNSPPTHVNTKPATLSQSVSASINAASKNIITVCCCVVFFSAISRTLLELFPLSPILDAVAAGICEFSTGVLKISTLNIPIAQKLIITSFIVGFSGISVHLQVMAVTSEAGLSLKPYIIGKFLHAVISAILTGAVFAISDFKSSFSFARPTLSSSFAISATIMLVGVTAILFARLLLRKKL